MIFTKTCDYGIRATLYVAVNQNRPFVSIREISDNLNISFHFLTKILQKLTSENILVSLRGAKGGVALSKGPEFITVKQIIEAIDGPRLFENCVMGIDQCGSHYPCPMHDEWQPIRKQLDTLFETTTIKELADKFKTHDYKLASLLKHAGGKSTYDPPENLA